MELISISTNISPEDPVKCRRCLCLLSLIDFLIGFLMLSIWSFRLFPFPLMDDSLVDAFGIFGIIWLFLLYSLQVIMAMIFCGGTQKIEVEETVAKFQRWFKGSVLMILMLAINNFLFLLTDGLEITTLPAYLVNILQIMFRFFATIFLIFTNRKLIFKSYAFGLHQRIVSRNIGIDRIPCGGNNTIMFSPSFYPDLPPSYEEATTEDAKLYDSIIKQ